jgi:hypothetical protein
VAQLSKQRLQRDRVTGETGRSGQSRRINLTITRQEFVEELEKLIVGTVS